MKWKLNIKFAWENLVSWTDSMYNCITIQPGPKSLCGDPCGQEIKHRCDDEALRLNELTRFGFTLYVVCVFFFPFDFLA